MNRATELLLAFAVVAVIVYGLYRTIDWYFNVYLATRNKDDLDRSFSYLAEEERRKTVDQTPPGPEK